MPWKGVTVSEQRQRFLEDNQLNDYTVTELAERFSISRKTAHKWIKRYKEHGPSGYEERSLWAWHHDTIALFRRLDSNLWETSGHNPLLMLGLIEQAKLEAAANDVAPFGPSGPRRPAP